MQSPYYGSEHIAKMYTPAFMRITTGTVLSKPATVAAATTELYGTTNATATFTATADEFDAGEYILFSTPQNQYCFYSSGTAGATPAPVVTGVDVYIPLVLGDTSQTVADIITQMQNACEKIEDLTFSSASPDFTLTALNKGYAPIGTIGTTSQVLKSSAAGVGDWALIGKLGEEINLTPESINVMDSEGGENQVGVDYSLEFSLINVNARSVEIVNTEFNRKSVDIAFFDVTNEEAPLYIIHGISCNATHNPFGESGSINFKMKKRFRDPSTKIKFYDWAYTN